MYTSLKRFLRSNIRTYIILYVLFKSIPYSWLGTLNMLAIRVKDTQYLPLDD